MLPFPPWSQRMASEDGNMDGWAGHIAFMDALPGHALLMLSYPTFVVLEGLWKPKLSLPCCSRLLHDVL